MPVPLKSPSPSKCSSLTHMRCHFTWHGHVGGHNVWGLCCGNDAKGARKAPTPPNHKSYHGALLQLAVVSCHAKHVLRAWHDAWQGVDAHGM